MLAMRPDLMAAVEEDVTVFAAIAATLFIDGRPINLKVLTDAVGIIALRTTPANVISIADRAWTIAQLVDAALAVAPCYAH